MTLIWHIKLCEILKGMKSFGNSSKGIPSVEEIVYELKTIRIRAHVCKIEQALAFRDQKQEQSLGRAALLITTVTCLLAMMQPEVINNLSHTITLGLTPTALMTFAAVTERLMRSKLHKWMDANSQAIDAITL
mgnify:CR=1 FL=1